MKSLVIGKGEVGKSLYEVLSPYYDTQLLGRDDEFEGEVEILHICFPFSEKFESEVKRYREKYKPKYTVVHSTVPPKTCERLGITHSPIRGNHPFLAQSIRTFVKFVGGVNADEVAEYFRRAGLKVYICRSSTTTELGKIFSTTYYGLCIEFIKEMEQTTRKYKTPFSEAFTLFQDTYNKGWCEMGHPEYQRPILQPIQKNINGHCVLPNLELIKTKFTTFLKKLNKV